ncbi:hypothetical protein SPRG_16218 [Saprolegnia parasitica CBS 223.65]|uniref:Inward rectifier potassium channel C-terminal domain-containing protein n=1 Tax=Saprolegnia parasitica (strain CBS 223.65) TaxID=695850 RepID=A0A067BJP5_SAPPC|nr:hypothetical protein SPRG_16218 [Saprolegnia parasitica CBS 223.65]KDO18398.1 hypothetical protein SPRG_16218 [Saprolegnia parasitica CBS 223.65]|eukprot:XP_012210896.1 hypothetical protein SPRG_16218 [Saprolegnia parasitica CBS 223.65]
MHAMWQRVWLGLTLPATASTFPSSLSNDKRASTQRFFGKPIEWVHGSPRPAYKDVIYMLLHWSWPRLWCFVTVVYCSITVLLGLVFYEICDECDVFSEGLGMSYQAFSTIGFGIVYPMHRCGNYVIIVEAFASMLMLPAMGGLLFSKLSIPRLRVAFSNVVVLQPNYVNGLPALVFRVANPSPSTHLETDVLLDVRFLAELHIASRLGGNHVLQRFDLPLQQSSFIFFRFALELVHVIDATSPLAPFAVAMAMEDDAMVITLAMEAVDANRHTSVLDQHAYAQADVRVGFRFARMLSPQSAAKLALDFDLLHAVEAAPMVAPVPLLRKPAPATMCTRARR